MPLISLSFLDVYEHSQQDRGLRVTYPSSLMRCLWIHVSNRENVFERKNVPELESFASYQT